MSQELNTLEVYSPLGDPLERMLRDVTATRGDVAGSRVGILDNGKHNANELMHHIVQILDAELGGLTVLAVRKETSSVPASTELIERLAAECDFVLTGTGDCGSCTTWSIHDTIALEQAGVPAIVLCTKPFVSLAETIAANESQSIRIAEVEHPSGGIDPDTVVLRAQATAPIVKALLEQSPAAVAS